MSAGVNQIGTSIHRRHAQQRRSYNSRCKTGRLPYVRKPIRSRQAQNASGV
jgi:hypothetical protein